MKATIDETKVATLEDGRKKWRNRSTQAVDNAQVQKLYCARLTAHRGAVWF